MKQPTAWIAVNGNQIRLYEANKYYLKSGTEFEIVLDNPTTSTYLAKISINGLPISNSGIILRAGERVNLDRYIDNPRRFKFETYSVPKENGDAIANNGLIKVEFHQEDLVRNFKPMVKKTRNEYDIWQGSPSFYYYGTKTVGVNPARIECSCVTRSFNSGTNSNVETGKVEMGNHSSQKLKEDNSHQFCYYTIYETTFQILPISQQTLHNDIRLYCTNCGRKIQKKWKFCASCGSKA